jgi:hypothetical protein
VIYARGGFAIRREQGESVFILCGELQSAATNPHSPAKMLYLIYP